MSVNLTAICWIVRGEYVSVRVGGSITTKRLEFCPRGNGGVCNASVPNEGAE